MKTPKFTDGVSGCKRIGCGNTARWRVLVELYAPHPWPGPGEIGANPAKMYPGVSICDDCYPLVKAEGAQQFIMHWISTGQWSKITSAFQEQGKIIPDPKRSVIAFEDLNQWNPKS
jgi:hypothetical protein